MCEARSESTAVFVLDGGFSTQVARHVGRSPDGDPLWSARFLQTHPDDVVMTHLDYLRAGSDIIETNTYQASIGGFVKHLNVNDQEGYALIMRAVELAQRARQLYQDECLEAGLPIPNPLIAGSVGPYGAHLLDGSEYTGNYADVTSVDTMKEWHTPRIQALVEAGADILAFETIPCIKEAEMLMNVLKQFPDVKGWLSFSCKDDHSIAHGEDFVTAVNRCWELNPTLLAIGVNCCPPDIVAKLCRSVNEHREDKIPFITYPNSGEKYSLEVGWIGEKYKPLAEYVPEWLESGVKYIGSCCRTGDTDIKLIKEKVQLWLENKANAN